MTGWTLGEVGVVMFFAMSGFLIARSWTDQPALLPFAAKRALRLLPALLVTALAVGPAFTVLPIGEYLSDTGTWGYVVRSSLLYTVAGRLPGVFEDNDYPDAVNGSLWTLPVESAAYVMAAALCMLGILRRSRLMLAMFAVVLFCATPLSPLASSLSETVTGGNLAIVLVLVATFLLGSLLHAARRRLRMS